MNIHLLDTGLFKLDGGAMFGVVPKSLWERKYAADEKNLCTWGMRCMLVEDGKKLILVDTGIGNKQDESFFKHYYLQGDTSIVNAVNKAGFSADEVTDVFHTHLHFDHCGGAVLRNGEGQLIPTFKNAEYWTHASHWRWATQPNPREKASFLKENIGPMHESGQLKLIENPDLYQSTDLGFSCFVVNGHTEGQMLPVVQVGDKKILYCADLIPSYAHIAIPWVMGYDTRPLLTMDEKVKILDWAVAENAVLVFEHDAQNQAAVLEKVNDRIQIKATGNLSEFL